MIQIYSYDLSGYATKGQPERVHINGKEYLIEWYQGIHEGEYSQTEIVGNKANGDAFLFQDGLKKLHWQMRDGRREGFLRVFQHGKLVRETDWSFFSTYHDEMPWFEPGKDGGEKVLVLEDVGTGHIVYRGEFKKVNEEFKRDGYGIEYDRESGEVMRSGFFRSNRFVCHHQKLIMNDAGEKTMYEYSRDDAGRRMEGNPLYAYPVYVGGYVYDELTCRLVRDGFGTLYDDSGEYLRDCEYSKGVDVELEKEKRHSDEQSVREMIGLIVSEMAELRGELKEHIAIVVI